MSFGEEKQSSLVHQRDVGQLVVAEIDSHLMCIERELSTAFHDHVGLELSLDKRKSILGDLFSRYNCLVSLSYVDRDGKELMRIGGSDRPPLVVPDYTLDHALLNSSQEERSYFNVQRGGDGEAGLLVIINTPVPSLSGDSNGGTLIAGIRLHNFFNVRDYDLKASDLTLYVVDGRGRLVDSSGGGQGELNNMSFLNSHEWVEETRLDNGEKVLRAVVEKRYNTLELYFVVQRPLQSFFRQLPVLLSRIWLVILLVSVVALYLGRVAVGKITEPLNKLIDEARLVKDTDAELRVQVSPHDEVGELAVIINELAVSLRDSISSLKREVYDKEQAEKQGACYRAFFQGVIDVMDEVILYKDHDCKLLGCNKAAEELLGASRQDLNGNIGVADIIAANDAVVLKESDYRAMQSGRLLRMEDWVEYPDGRRLLLNTLTAPVYLENGEISGLVRVSRDITTTKSNDMELATLRDQVSELRKEEVVGTFAVGVAHDFNNLLGAILGYTEMVMEELATDSQTRKDLENVMDASMRAKDLVYQILAFARGTEGEGIVMTPVSLVKELSKKISESLPQSIEMVMDIDPDCAAISMDPSDLYQLLLELCAEARRVMADAIGVLKVKLNNETLSVEEFSGKSVGGTDEYLKLEVSYALVSQQDNELKKHIEPFYTSTVTPTLVAGGESALVRQLVEKNNGVFMTDVDPGKETKFRVYFPVVREESE
ncbi:MAG: PAS domain S-box protein [Desulfobulbaceae bacterium]|nr:PAS domain S-box protein [Desulfobulbaceae bacterium]